MRVILPILFCLFLMFNDYSFAQESQLTISEYQQMFSQLRSAITEFASEVDSMRQEYPDFVNQLGIDAYIQEMYLKINQVERNILSGTSTNHSEEKKSDANFDGIGG
jgi:hypothetical protein